MSEYTSEQTVSVDETATVVGDLAPTLPEVVHHYRQGFDWTKERIEQLTQLLEIGMTASEIAHEMGTTRNSVIGKANRLGLKKGERSADLLPKPRAPRRPMSRSAISMRETRRVERIYQSSRTVSHVKVETVEVPDLPDEDESCLWPRVTVDTVKLGMCRWPCNDPWKSEEFFFCGRDVIKGHSYCSNHCQLSYRKTRDHTGKRHVPGWVAAMIKQAKELEMRSAAEVPASQEQSIAA